MNDNGYYMVKLIDYGHVDIPDVVALFKRNPQGTAKTSYIYRMYLKPLSGFEPFEIAKYGRICDDREIIEIRHCNENEKALLETYIRRYEESRVRS